MKFDSNLTLSFLLFYSYIYISGNDFTSSSNTGSQEVQHVEENINICSNHEECDARPSQIKLTKGFSAKEQVKGHMVSSSFHNLIDIIVVKKWNQREDIYIVLYFRKETKNWRKDGFWRFYLFTDNCDAGECCERIEVV